ncbi:helix-turn-helix domain-containing protein [Streptomyces sp. NPDC056401]|uniref:helix-turn-helix domain-containing protein n=1 Tax=Streptomyces sp. NPDC056401 TaxID=3345809 RepID=UPI0035DD1DF1
MTSSASDQARAAIGQRFRSLRAACGMTGRELAALTGWHPTKISKIERGRMTPSAEDVRIWLDKCGASDQEEEFQAAVAGVSEMYIPWHHLEYAGLRTSQTKVMPEWESANLFRAYSHSIVPGPLQTGEYTRAVLSSIRDRRGLVDDVELAVEARLRKHELLADPARKFEVVLEECVLRRLVSTAEVTVKQLTRLIDLSYLPHVDIRIIPHHAEAAPRSRGWPVEDFWIFDSAHVAVELVSAYMTFTADVDVRNYEKTFSDLFGQGVGGAEARQILFKALGGAT